MRAAAVTIPPARIAQAIWIMRGLRVMLDADLAALYDVSTKALNQAVKRNAARFPEDFMFQMTWEEAQALQELSATRLSRTPTSRSQSVTLTARRGVNVKYRPYVFTEQGVAMLSSVLRSERAVAVNIAIMRAFVQLREWLSTNQELAKKLDAMERKIAAHDQAIAGVLDAIRQLMSPPPEPKKRPIGFASVEEHTRKN